ncbi:MAG TPA: histidine phosphatase family protein [Caulobacteraceae bacterium]|jgi:probable phosphoglycerate mutase
MELILIRHGLPVRSAETDDPPLSDEGHDQARRVGARLGAEKIDTVWASTMRRAVETAQPFAAAAGHEVRTSPGIVEFDRGSGAYTPMEVLKREDYAAWKAFVDNGYGDMDVFARLVVETLEGIVADNSGKTVAVFCHGGVINAWTSHVLGMPPRLFFEPKYASVHRFLCARSGERNLVSLNDIGHLRS